jgi:hypothetical protein
MSQYSRFATTYLLERTEREEPELFNAATELIISELELDEDFFSQSAFLKHVDQETKQQRSEQETCVLEWVSELQNYFTPDYRECHKVNFVTQLFYSIRRIRNEERQQMEVLRFKEQSDKQRHLILGNYEKHRGSDTELQARSNCVEDPHDRVTRRPFNWDSRKSVREWRSHQTVWEHEMEKLTEDSQEVEVMTEVPTSEPSRLARYLLQKVELLHFEKFRVVLEGHAPGEIEEWMVGLIRPVVWHVCMQKEPLVDS